METALVVIGVVLLGFLLVMKNQTSRTNEADLNPEQSAQRPPEDYKPTVPAKNDKLVIIAGVTYDELKKAIQQFCNLYNREDYAALPLLSKISEQDFAATFPFDVEFDIFCYFINYLKYPHGIFYTPSIAAWTNTTRSDEWIADEVGETKVMLFIPNDDDEHDIVFLTTQFNMGYKIVSIGYAVKELGYPKLNYIEPRIDLASLEQYPSEQFQ